MSAREVQERIVESMKAWQKIEDASVASTGRIIEKTKNPLIRLVAEIIQADSILHHKVQGFITRSLEHTPVSLDIDDLAAVWDAVEKRNEIEQRMVGHLQEILGAIRGRKLLVQEYLLNYLREDESKHEKLLQGLEQVKKGIYPYA